MTQERADSLPNGRLSAKRPSIHDPVTLQASLAGASARQASRGPGRRSIKPTFEAIKIVANKAVNKVRPHPFADDNRPALNEVRHDAAFNPTKVEKELNLHRDGATDKDQNSPIASNIAHAVAHPKKAAKHKLKKVAAGHVVSGPGPLTSRAREVRFLDDADALYRSSLFESDADLVDEDGAPISRGQLLEARRDSLRAALATSQIRRVGVVGKEKPYPSRALFTIRDDNGNPTDFQWEKWIGHLVLYYTQKFSAKYVDRNKNLPFDITTTRSYVERIITGSGHWQTWMMDLRSVYRWEDRVRTAKWYATYIILWYTSRMMTFFWAYVLYHVLSNRYWSESVAHVNDAAKRALDREATAFQIGELIDRHGEEEWLDPLIQEVGPYAQLQLGDLADLLEVLHNFYSWKSPSKTVASLYFFAACLLVTLFGDMEFCMKITWFVSGNIFFLCWPIASRYPQYRHLVSPFKWIFWDIPTHAELSFKYLRNHAQLSCEGMIQRKIQGAQDTKIFQPSLTSYAGHMDISKESDTDTLSSGVSDFDHEEREPGPDTGEEDWHSTTSADSTLQQEDMLGFRARYKNMTGRLYVYSSGMRFVRNVPRRELWNLPFQQLEEMWKAGSGRRRKLTLGGMLNNGILELKSASGEIFSLDPIKYRDEAFNCIVGFSALQWQVLQPEPGKGRKSRKAKKEHA